MVCEHQRTVFAVALGKLRNIHDAEDVMQDVFVEAYRNVDKLKKHEKPAAWLLKRTTYRCKDHMRRVSRRKKHENIFADSMNYSINPQAEGLVENGVLEVIGKLPEKHRVLVMLKHFAKLSYTEISEITGLPKTTIDGRLRAAKGKLRHELMKIGEGVERT